jgi:hypothetical protein
VRRGPVPGDTAIVLACLFPRPHDDLWRLNENAYLINDSRFDLCGWYPADGHASGPRLITPVET